MDNLFKQINHEHVISDKNIKCFIKMLKVVRDFKEHNLYLISGLQRLVLITKMEEDTDKIEILSVFLSFLDYNYKKNCF